MSELPKESADGTPYDGTGAAGTPGPAGRERWVALAVCCGALFITLLDVSVTNVALPSIADATGAGTQQLQWVVSGYTLAFGLVPVLAGRLGDDHGRRVMFQVGIAGFVVTSLLAGLAPNAEVLIAARVAQGISGGLINPQVSGLVQQMFSGAERGRAFGWLGVNVGVGTAIGPLVGGALIALGGPDLGWRLVFFVNVPIGIAVILLGRRYLPSTPSNGSHRLDMAGALLLGGATFCVLIGSIELDHAGPVVLVLAVPAVVLGWAFWRRERRLTATRSDPLVDLRLFRRPSYTSGVVLALLYFPAQAGLPLVMALYFQRGLGYSALDSALGVTAFAVGSAAAAPLAGRQVNRRGRRLVVGAAATFGVGAIALALVARTEPQTHVVLVLAGPLFVMGLGNGALITPNQALTLMDVDPVAGSTAGGVLQTGQRIGLAVGQAVIGSTFLAVVGDGTGSRTYGAALSAAVVAALVFVAGALAVGVRDLRRERVVDGRT